MPTRFLLAATGGGPAQGRFAFASLGPPCVCAEPRPGPAPGRHPRRCRTRPLAHGSPRRLAPFRASVASPSPPPRPGDRGDTAETSPRHPCDRPLALCRGACGAGRGQRGGHVHVETQESLLVQPVRHEALPALQPPGSSTRRWRLPRLARFTSEIASILLAMTRKTALTTSGSAVASNARALCGSCPMRTDT